MDRSSVEEASKYAADIFATLLGFEGFVEQIDIRMDFDRTVATLQIRLIPDVRK